PARWPPPTARPAAPPAQAPVVCPPRAVWAAAARCPIPSPAPTNHPEARRPKEAAMMRTQAAVESGRKFPPSARAGRDTPSDWPAPGPIDLRVHDLPHASAVLEWWYVNTQLETTAGRRYGVFAAFFRQAIGRNAAGAIEYAHSLAWALSD